MILSTVTAAGGPMRVHDRIATSLDHVVTYVCQTALPVTPEENQVVTKITGFITLTGVAITQESTKVDARATENLFQTDDPEIARLVRELIQGHRRSFTTRTRCGPVFWAIRWQRSSSS